MLRVVFDTNVYISAFSTEVARSKSAFRMVKHGKAALYVSVDILMKTACKLRDKFSMDDEDITTVLKTISKISTVIKTERRISLLADEPDNRILDCAVQAKADLIVTGDRHLLALREYEGIVITTVAGFVYSVQ